MQNTVLTVTQLNNQAKYLLEKQFSQIWVEGEIGSFKTYGSGHSYFTLKDDGSEISSVLFAHQFKGLSFQPHVGQKVVAHGTVSLYPQRGQYQFVVSHLHMAGKGNLWEEFEALKGKLDAEGLFSQTSKLPIPQFPEKVGVITSQDGAVIRDIINVMNRRAPHIQVMLRPAVVQGDNAEDSLIQSIEDMVKYQPNVDVIIIGRGGGSMEDLWCFNSEKLVRKIHEINIPIISAVGHETDFTLTDFVSDLRAPTPSAAAEIVSPVKADLIEFIDEQQDRLLATVQQRILNYYQQIEMAILKYDFHKPSDFFQIHKEKFNRLSAELVNSTEKVFRKFSHSLQLKTQMLHQLNPTSIIERGFAVVYDEDGNVVKDSDSVKLKDRLKIQLHQSVVHSTVNKIEKSNE